MKIKQKDLPNTNFDFKIIQPKEYKMATCTAYKIIFNNCVLPEIYFSYDVAKEQLHKLEKSNCACFGRVVLYDNETGQVGN